MATSLVNFRMDTDLKNNMEHICSELGINMSTAFNIYAKKMCREKRIPFDVSIEPCFSEEDVKSIKKSISELNEGKYIKKSIAELELMEK